MLSAASASSAWQWTSCGQQPRTLSFRQEQQQQQTMKQQQQQAYYKTMNSAYSVDYSCFSTNSYDDEDSFVSTASEANSPLESSEEAEEAVVTALRSDRLFFDPDDASSCISKKKNPTSRLLTMKKAAGVEEDDDHQHPAAMSSFGGATAMSVETQNPYRDFRESMEAVVMSHGGVKDWCWLEEMLGWYLRANGKSKHGLIVGAFVDLLVSLSNTSPASSSSSPANCSSDDDDDECPSSSCL